MDKIFLPLRRSSVISSRDEIIVSTRLAILRNIDGLPFPDYLPHEDKEQLEEKLSQLVKSLETNPLMEITLDSYDLTSKKNLTADLVITEEFMEFGNKAYAQKDGSWIFLINEKEHIKLFNIHFGCRLKETYKQLYSIIKELDEKIHFAFHPKLGYLTSFVDYAGTGVFFSALVNLSGLELSGKIDILASSCIETGYQLIPLTGTKDSKYFYIKNISTFGLSEHEQITNFSTFLKKLQEQEIDARKDIINSSLELLVSQLEINLAQDALNYAEALETIALTEILHKKTLTIRDRERWQELIFRIHPYSEFFNGFIDEEEINNFRAIKLKNLFTEIVSKK